MRKILVVISLLLIITMIISVMALRIPPSMSMVVSLAGLGFPLIWMICLICLVLAFLYKIKRLQFILLLIIIITLPLIARYFSFSLKQANETYKYSIFDFNGFGFREFFKNSDQTENQDSIHQYINSQDFTIACFQEYPMKGSKHARFYKNLQEGLNLNFKALSEYNPQQKSTSLILVTASKFPIIQKKILSYNSVPFAMYTDIRFPEGIIRVYNIHLMSVKLIQERKLLMLEESNHPENILEHVFSTIRKLKIAFNHREKQTKILTESLDDCPYPVIIAGDFNDTPISYCYSKISKGLKDSSSRTVAGFKRTYKYSSFPLQIDYILHSESILTSSYKRLSNKISDHYAIKSNFKIK
ncbi:MAG: endonuclease/exonuclease/phosphatase family protein [Omnitrophica WOR_2 bacterium]